MKKATFQKNEEGVKLMAIYIAQLTREGMEYQLDNTVNHYTVIITGF
jgi:hypothetical protein